MFPGARNIFVSAIPVIENIFKFIKHLNFDMRVMKNCFTKRLEERTIVSIDSEHTVISSATTGARDMCSRDALYDPAEVSSKF